MVRAAGKDDALSTGFGHIFQYLFSFFLRICSNLLQFIPCMIYGSLDFRGRNFFKFLFQSVCNGFGRGKGHKRVAEYDLSFAYFLHVIFNIFRIGGYNRTVVVVIGIFKFLALIENGRVEDEIRMLLDKPCNVTMR